MLSKSLRVKLLLLLVLAVSAVGVGTSNASGCSYVQCKVISSGGINVGYACIDGVAFGGCEATVNSCRLIPCA